MNFPPFNTPIYRTVNNSIQTLIFKRVVGSIIYLEDEHGVTVKMPVSQYQNLCLSKRILLAELEEALRIQIETVHEEMRSLAVEFNPIGYAQVVLQSYGNPTVEVHNYSISSGRYINTYPSISEAAREMGDVSKKSAITRACLGKRPTAYGYRWSYDRVDRLPASHSVIRSSISCKSSSEK